MFYYINYNILYTIIGFTIVIYTNIRNIINQKEIPFGILRTEKYNVN